MYPLTSSLLVLDNWVLPPRHYLNQCLISVSRSLQINAKEIRIKNNNFLCRGSNWKWPRWVGSHLNWNILGNLLNITIKPFYWSSEKDEFDLSNISVNKKFAKLVNSSMKLLSIRRIQFESVREKILSQFAFSQFPFLFEVFAFPSMQCLCHD